MATSLESMVIIYFLPDFHHTSRPISIEVYLFMLPFLPSNSHIDNINDKILYSFIYYRHIKSTRNCIFTIIPHISYPSSVDELRRVLEPPSRRAIHLTEVKERSSHSTEVREELESIQEHRFLKNFVISKIII